MTTSGVTTFSMTGDQICKSALRKLNVISEGANPTAQQLSDATEALNAMITTLVAKGMPLWVVTEYDLTMTSTKTYTFGVGQTINIPAPLKVTQAILKDLTGETSFPLNVRSHYDYNLLSNQGSEGTPTTYWYEPLNQTGVLHIWPTPDSYSITNRVITIVYQRPFYGQVSGTDTLDFPQCWQEAMIYGLVWRIAPEYGLPIQDRKDYGLMAEYFLQEALSFGTEEGSMYLQPDWTIR